MIVDEHIRVERLNICKGCKYYFDNNWLAKIVRVFGVKTGTCGRPIIGQKVEEGKLCGCVMASKAALEGANCPINKW